MPTTEPVDRRDLEVAPTGDDGARTVAVVTVGLVIVALFLGVLVRSRRAVHGDRV